jgi:hypothetical protein
MSKEPDPSRDSKLKEYNWEYNYDKNPAERLGKPGRDAPPGGGKQKAADSPRSAIGGPRPKIDVRREARPRQSLGASFFRPADSPAAAGGKENQP